MSKFYAEIFAISLVQENPKKKIYCFLKEVTLLGSQAAIQVVVIKHETKTTDYAENKKKKIFSSLYKCNKTIVFQWID